MTHSIHETDVCLTPHITRTHIIWVMWRINITCIPFPMKRNTCNINASHDSYYMSACNMRSHAHISLWNTCNVSESHVCAWLLHMSISISASLYFSIFYREIYESCDALILQVFHGTNVCVTPSYVYLYLSIFLSLYLFISSSLYLLWRNVWVMWRTHITSIPCHVCVRRSHEHMCDVTQCHTYVCVTVCVTPSHTYVNICVTSHMSFTYVWEGVTHTYVTWKESCTHGTYVCFPHIYVFICVPSILHMCDMTASHV